MAWFCAATLAGFCSAVDTLANGQTVEPAIEAQFCTAYNRHVMQSFASWDVLPDYYLTRPDKAYSHFWHRHSVGGLAYGFAYDDVNGQSSTIQSASPERMALGIGW